MCSDYSHRKLKGERELKCDVTDVQGDIDGDMTLSERVYSDWCEPVYVEKSTAVSCVLP